MQYQALHVTETDGKTSRKITSLNMSDLPASEVLVKVHYAGLNYKDALSATGNKGVTRQYPHTPGIDAAGEVVESQSSDFPVGTEVIVTSYDLGMNTPGGFGAYIRVPANWVVPLPKAFSLYESMIHGTAGFTAGLALYKMEMSGQTPAMGPVLVTGATGGVGSLAVAILQQAGYEVMAVTGKTDAADYLKSLGATSILPREELADQPKRPMLKGRWAGVIDTVGGEMLTAAIKSCQPNGNIATCGLVASPSFDITVFPFIIRGVNLLGVESAECPMPTRKAVWGKLATEWAVPQLQKIGKTCTLQELDGYIDQILAGKTRGRIVLKHAAAQ